MNGSASRERILDAAFDLFLTGTYHNVGVTEICKAASVNKGTLYHYFDSKTDVLIAVLERYTETIAIEYERVGRGPSEAGKRLQAFFALAKFHNARYSIEKGFCPGCFIGNISTELATNEPRVRAKAQWAMDRLIRIFEPTVAELLRDAGIEGNSKVAATEFMMLLQGTQVLARLHNDAAVFDVSARAAADLVLASVRGDVDADDHDEDSLSSHDGSMTDHRRPR